MQKSYQANAPLPPKTTGKTTTGRRAADNKHIGKRAGKRLRLKVFTIFEVSVSIKV